jgi:hypothetical protein
LGFSLSLQVPTAASESGGLQSPIEVRLSVREASGRGAPIVEGRLAVRDSGGNVLAQTPIPANIAGQASAMLNWVPVGALGRRLDISISVLDTDGAVHVLERSLSF